MKRVYLDWGVVSYLKKDEYAVLKDLLLSNKDRLFLVYSSAHLEDLMKSKGEPQFDDDIKMLSDLVEDHLLDLDKGKVFLNSVTPEDFCRNYVENYSKIPRNVDSLLTTIEAVSNPDDNLINQIKANLNMPFPIPPEYRSNELFARLFPNLPESPIVKDVIDSVLQLLYDITMNPGSYKKHRSFIHTIKVCQSQNERGRHLRMVLTSAAPCACGAEGSLGHAPMCLKRGNVLKIE